MLLHHKSVPKLLSKSAVQKMTEHLDAFNSIAFQYYDKYLQTKLAEDFPDKAEIRGDIKDQ
jgi:hypothetical protein